MGDLSNMVIPRHVAIILDGNGRWAKKRGLPRTMGHREGCKTVEKTVEIAARIGIEYLTVYGFSTENWSRSVEEVGALMQLFRYYNDVGDRIRARRLADRVLIDDLDRLDLVQIAVEPLEAAGLASRVVQDTADGRVEDVAHER